MTMLEAIRIELLRWLYALACRWPEALSELGLTAVVGTAVLAAWRLRRANDPHASPTAGREHA